MKKNDKRALTLRTQTIGNLSADKLQSVNGGWTTIIISATAGFTTQLSGTVSGSGGGTTAGTGG